MLVHLHFRAPFGFQSHKLDIFVAARAPPPPAPDDRTGHTDKVRTSNTVIPFGPTISSISAHGKSIADVIVGAVAFNPLVGAANVCECESGGKDEIPLERSFGGIRACIIMKFECTRCARRTIRW